MKHTNSFVAIQKLIESPQEWNKQATLMEIRKRNKLVKISELTGDIVSAHSSGHPGSLEPPICRFDQDSTF